MLIEKKKSYLDTDSTYFVKPTFICILHPDWFYFTILLSDHVTICSSKKNDTVDVTNWLICKDRYTSGA